MKTVSPSHLIFALIAVAAAPLGSAIAQVNFSDQSPQNTILQESLNACAEKQTKTVCLNALSLSQVLHRKNALVPDTADSIMQDAVEVLPYYVLAKLYLLDKDHEEACTLAISGELKLREIAGKTRTLSERDPEAFKNVETTFEGLNSLNDQFLDIQQHCPGS